ncbi:MAG: aminomethyl transferase family protein [Deltaproteobacteria bacterium]|nr:aminomethyl transferase family protein [Deltaproteobacteria bacterium]
MQKDTQKTLLYDWHISRGASMGNFGGYDMPLWYPAGAKNEHLAVLFSAGLFDTSHMAAVTAAGPDAFELLQRCFTRDLSRYVNKDESPSAARSCAYGVFLNQAGEVIDDAIVYPLNPQTFMIVVNAGMGGKIARHLSDHLEGGDVRITDLTGQLGKLDVQGPMAGKVLVRILKEPQKVLEDMAYFKYKGHYDKVSPSAEMVLLTDGTPILLSRTGYTGEFGFEIFIEFEHLAPCWEMIIKAGEPFEMRPCGLAARDSLRAGAMLPLSHQDIGPWLFVNNPWTFALPYNADFTDFTKRFIGDTALKRAVKAEYTYAFAGYDPRKVSVHDPALVLDLEDDELGLVMTCVTDTAIGRIRGRIYSVASPDLPGDAVLRGLSCGFVRVKTRLDYGQMVKLKDRRREITVEIVDDIRPNRTANKPISEMLPG